MYFNVSQLMKETSGSTRAYEIDDLAVLVEGSPASHIVGRVSLIKTDRGVWISASLDTNVVCTCSRCLVEYGQPVHMDIEEEFFPVIDIHTGARLHFPTEFEQDFYIDQNHILDLSEAARQYLQLNIPMKPICMERCAGICPTCGVNLNDAECLCDKAPRDPRWGKLLDLVSPTGRDN